MLKDEKSLHCSFVALSCPLLPWKCGSIVWCTAHSHKPPVSWWDWTLRRQAYLEIIRAKGGSKGESVSYQGQCSWERRRRLRMVRRKEWDYSFFLSIIIYLRRIIWEYNKKNSLNMKENRGWVGGRNLKGGMVRRKL